jgi:hypothetical protein
MKTIFLPGQLVVYGEQYKIIMVEQCGYLSTIFEPKAKTFHIVYTFDLKPLFA